MRKKLFCLCLGLLMVGLSVVPLASAQAQREITMWLVVASGHHYDALAGVNEHFEKANPDIKIKVTAPIQLSKYLISVASGTPPDICMLARDIVADYEEALRPIDSKEINCDPKDFWACIAKDLQVQGQEDKIWGVPQNGDFRVLFYNKDQFREVGLDPEKPPVNFQELKEYAGRLTKRDTTGKLTRLGYSPLIGNLPINMRLICLLVQMYGGQVLNEEKTKVIFDSPMGVKALKWIVDFVDFNGGMKEHDVFAANFGGGAQYPIFTDQVAMAQLCCDVPTLMKMYRPDLEWGVNYGVADLPIPQGGTVANFASGWLWPISKGAKNTDDALKFLEFAVGEKEQLFFALTSGSFPGLESISVSEDFLKGMGPAWESLAKIYERVATAPWTGVLGVPRSAEFYSVSHKYLQEAIYDKMSVEEAVKKMAAGLQTILEKK